MLDTPPVPYKPPTMTTTTVSTGPAEHAYPGPVRYDIITGYPIYNEPTSGYKEGVRAVVETLRHVNAVTNARTPGYNIITGRDPMMGGGVKKVAA
ncbi:hypothetical protein HK104_007785 [Borealophlyctis nickersoniae]|nr:hypothetical protein HK104_007785 [Borealophlyctis nickersoniae]